MPQFRPNLMLFPPLLAFALLRRSCAASSAAAIVARWRAYSRARGRVALAPWTIRNYRLTGELLPTSTHGGVQLWYGTLQIGPYLESRAHNPRSVFERRRSTTRASRIGR